jgi:hypothetical protein
VRGKLNIFLLLQCFLTAGPLKAFCMLICLSSSPGPPMQGNTNNYSGGAVVSAVPSMVKNDPTSTSSNVCKVNPSCFSGTSVYLICTHVYKYVTANDRLWGELEHLVWIKYVFACVGLTQCTCEYINPLAY